MICGHCAKYGPSTSLVPVCLYINISAGEFRFSEFHVPRSVCTRDGTEHSPELSPYQCVYLHPGNYLAVKPILHVSAPVENVPVYSTKLS